MTHAIGWRAQGASILAGLALIAVLAGPGAAITVSPGAVLQGNSAVMTIATPGETWSPGVTVDLGAGITVSQVDVSNPELLLVQAEVDMNASAGTRNVVIQQNGNFVVGADVFRVLQTPNGNQPSGHADTFDTNAVTNPGFETGDMTGWIPVTWTIDTTLPHSGTYDAHDLGGSGGGGQCLRQDFNPPVDSNTITSFTFWLRQPDDLGIAQVAVWYQNSATRYGVAFTNDDDSWTFEDQTALIIPNDFVVAIHVCGFGGGMPTPDDSWADDFDMRVAGGTPVVATSWGRIKGLYQETGR